MSDPRTLWVSVDGEWAAALCGDIPSGAMRSANRSDLASLLKHTPMPPPLGYTNDVFTGSTFPAMVRRTTLPWEPKAWTNPLAGRDQRTVWVSDDGEWAAVQLNYIPVGVMRSTSEETLYELKLIAWNSSRDAPDLKYPTDEGDNRCADVYYAYVKRTELPWEIDSYRGDRPTAPIRRVIPEYPAVCQDCSDRVYVGLNEIIHKSKPTVCRGRVDG